MTTDEIAAPEIPDSVEQLGAEVSASNSAPNLSLPSLRAVDPDPSWRALANCQGVDTRLFFADQLNSRSDTVRQIKEICGACEVSEECLRFALENDERGWWAGTSQRDRARMRSGGVLRLKRALGPINHGTPGGARQHHRRGEDPCQACKDAHAAYYNAWRQQRKEQGLSVRGRAS